MYKQSLGEKGLNQVKKRAALKEQLPVISDNKYLNYSLTLST